MRKCQKHNDQPVFGYCSNKGCQRLVCVQCMYESHNEHALDIVIFNLLEQKNPQIIMNLLKESGNDEKYRETLDMMKDEKYNKAGIEKMFREIQEKYQKTMRQLMDEMFKQQVSNFVVWTNRIQKQVLDELGNDSSTDDLGQEIKHMFRLDMLVEKAQQMLKNDDDGSLDAFKQEVKNYKEMDCQGLDQIRMKMMNRPNVQETVDRVDRNINEFIKTSQTKFNEVHVGIQNRMENMVGDINEQIENNNMKVLMKVSNTKLGMYNELWTDEEQVDQNELFQQMEFKRNMVFSDYYKLETEYIVIETVVDDKTLFTKLMKPSRQPLGQIMQQQQKQKLKYIDGVQCPIELFTHQTHVVSGLYSNYQLEWWLNYTFESYSCWRIGGAYFYYQNGEDQNQQLVEQEVSALGQYKYYEIGCGTILLDDRNVHKESNIALQVNIYAL